LIAAVFWALTARDVTVNVALDWPAATVTEAGTVATDVALLESVIDTPPVPAFPLRVTVPVDVLPPTTDVGLRVNEASVRGLMVKLAVLLTEP
jgi:hypothetical protein